MPKEIDISEVPLTPKGGNHDFKAVKQFQFVRFDKEVAWKTLSLIGPESDHSDYEDSFNRGDLLKENIDDLLDSPMIEFRKKKPNAIDDFKKFNPVNDEVNDTSIGLRKNYEKSKRKTIADMRRLSIDKPNYKLRNSLPASLSDTIKENLPPDSEPNPDIDTQHLNLLRVSLSESRPLVTTEYNRLNNAITDWKHILENEGDVTQEGRGRIKSVVGRTQLLLDKRFNSTFDVLDKADNFINNNGEIIDDNDKEYKPDDVYGFVDLLINEIRKVDEEYDGLLKMRENNWIEPEVTAIEPVFITQKKKAIINEPRKKLVRSKLDINSLRQAFTKGKTEKSDVLAAVDLQDGERGDGDKVVTAAAAAAGLSMASETGSLNEDSGRSLRGTVRNTVRDSSVIKSTTGTPVHFDTPRPRRSTRPRSAATNAALSSPMDHHATAPSPAPRKRSAAPFDDKFALPRSQPKKSRQSKY